MIRTLPARSDHRLKASSLDVISSLLLSLLTVVGMAVLLLFAIWLTRQPQPTPASTIEINREVGGRQETEIGLEREISVPGQSDTEDLAEPTLADALATLTDNATSVVAATGNALTPSTGDGGGDAREPGPIGKEEDVRPRHERWELKFRAPRLETYAEQLDYFSIELGAIGGGHRSVDFAFELSTAVKRRSESPSIENQRERLYFMWQRENVLKKYDVQLLEQAGIKTSSRMILKFIPKELESDLAAAESSYLAERDRQLKEVRKTIFECQPTTSGYEFVVVDQTYLADHKN